MLTTIWTKICAGLALLGAVIVGVAVAFFKGKSDGTQQAAQDAQAAELKAVKKEQRVDAHVDEVIHGLPVAPVTPEAPAVVLETAPADTSQARLNILAKGNNP